MARELRLTKQTVGKVAESVSCRRSWSEVPNSEARDRRRPMRRENGLRHNFPDKVTERTDGTGGSVDAVVGAAIGPYHKSRLIHHARRTTDKSLSVVMPRNLAP